MGVTTGKLKFASTSQLCVGLQKMQVRDAVCLITGSAQGLGKAFAVRLLEAGASCQTHSTRPHDRVCISDVKVEVGLAAQEELRGKFGKEKVFFVQCDVTKAEQLVRFPEFGKDCIREATPKKKSTLRRVFDECEAYFKVGCIDLLVNNAGINWNLGWRKCLEVNIIGVMTGTEIALERMKKQPNKGTIVNIGSTCGIMTGHAEESVPYSVSKHAVVALTRHLSACFKETGVEVKALCPAWATGTDIKPRVDVDERKLAARYSSELMASQGPMTTEYCAEGLFSLLTTRPEGSVMVCIAKTPFFVMPESNDLIFNTLCDTLCGTQTE